MELTYDEIEGYIETISNGKKIIVINDVLYILKYPSMFDRLMARHFYNVELKKAIDDGIYTNRQMEELIKKRGLFTSEDIQKLGVLHNKLDAQKVVLAKTTKVKAKRDRVKNIIIKIENDIMELEYKKKSKLSLTAESKADEVKMFYLCYSGVHDCISEKCWGAFDDFLNESDYDFRQTILYEFMLFYSGIKTEIIRSIARSSMWRMRYITSLKASEALFGIPTAEYTNDMVNLVYWSHFYQNIFDMMPEDQPSDVIIEDDRALDTYMTEYYKEKSRDAADRKSRNKQQKLSAFDKEEVIITRSNELYEDIEYNVPKEAQLVKDKNVIKKTARRR